VYFQREDEVLDEFHTLKVGLNSTSLALFLQCFPPGCPRSSINLLLLVVVLVVVLRLRWTSSGRVPTCCKRRARYGFPLPVPHP
jgi:hypothetical protein